MGWLLAGRAVRSFSQAFLVVAVPLYVAAAGYSTMQVGYLLTTASLGSVAFVMLIGLYADRYGRRRVMLVLAALSAFGATAFALTTRFWVLALAAGLASVGRGGGAGSGGAWGPFYPAEQALVADATSHRDRNAAFGGLSFVGVLAGALGSLAAGLPQVAHDAWHLGWLPSYRLLFWLAVVTAIAFFLLVLPLHETVKPQRAQEPVHLFTAETRSLIGRLWLPNAVNGFGWGLLGSFLTYWLYVRFGVGPAALGTLFTLVNLVAALPLLGAAVVARRLGAVATVVVTRVLSVAFFLAMVLAPTFTLASAFYLVRMIVGSLGMPVRQSFVMGVSEERSRSTVAAFGNLPGQITGAVSPSLGAYMMEVISLEAPLYFSALAQLLNAVTFLLAFRHTRPPEEQG